MDDKKTPLFAEHIKLNALMAPFGGWNMPIHYGSIIEETKHTRAKCSVFDICHMGEFIVKEDPSKSTLDKIITVPVAKMAVNSCRYGFLLNERGGVKDDLIVYRKKEDEWMVVVNASTEENDALEISLNLSPAASFDNISEKTLKLDIQGPLSGEVMKKLAGEKIDSLKYFRFESFKVLGRDCLISRTGYTGELGYEIYMDAEAAPELWNELLKNPDVKPAGLGSRDILRLEMGYPLYGDELSEEISPLEAGFERVIPFDKEFKGREALLKQKQDGIKRILTGFTVEGRRTPRHTNRVASREGADIGFVTSGVFSPHLNKGICMAYINKEHHSEDMKVKIVSERGSFDAVSEAMPFIKKTSIK